MKEVANEMVSVWTRNILTSSKGLLNKVGGTKSCRQAKRGQVTHLRYWIERPLALSWEIRYSNVNESKDGGLKNVVYNGLITDSKGIKLM
jgi:hypothetical protein